MPLWMKVWKVARLIFMVGLLEWMICRGLYDSARKGDWFWVFAAVFELQLFAAYFGWIAIEDFNTYQRLRRLAQKR